MNSATREKKSLSINSKAEIRPIPQFDYLSAMHDYSSELRVNLIENSNVQDIVVESESNTSPEQFLNGDNSSSISQTYSYIVPQTFYQ